MTTWLYRLLDDKGELLYVGLTRSPSSTAAQHSRKQWWPGVAQVQLQRYATEAEAMDAEASALQSVTSDETGDQLRLVTRGMLDAIGEVDWLREGIRRALELHTETAVRVTLKEILDTPSPYPGLALQPMGGLEVADRLGVKRETVAMWKLRGLLPPARWTVSGEDAWDWSLDIEPWAKQTGRLR